MADPIITAQDVVDLVGRGDTSDPGIAIAIAAASDVVRTFTERTITQTDGTATLNGHGGDALLLPELPVQSITSVTVGGSAVSDYVLDSNGILFRGGTAADAESTWPEGRQNIEVRYRHGWGSSDVPRDLKLVALAIAQRVVVQGAAVQEQVGQVSVKYAGAATDLTPTERAILAKYRQIR